MDMETLSLTQPSHRGLLAKAISLRSEIPAIVEEDGIFSIQDGLETGGVELDPCLKALVDSVLEPVQDRM